MISKKEEAEMRSGMAWQPMDGPRSTPELTPPMPADPTNGEIRVVNENTGGQKGQKVYRFDLIPWVPMYEVAKLYGKGAEKYAERNWERGYDWSLSYAAAMRHLTQFWNGESHDEETGCHHLSSVIFHCLAMMEFERTHPELDNRPKDK